MPPIFKKAVIVGVGQLGASVGMNLVAKRLAQEVVGIGRRRANLRKALRRKAIHRIGSTKDLAAADLIVLATPVQGIREYLKRVSQMRGAGGERYRPPLIIDVGSTKASIVKDAERLGLRFIGCHPIAGTEKAGAMAADRNLFRNQFCMITPPAGASKGDIQRVKGLWKRLGARTVLMDAKQHDRFFAVSSHLPHVLAFSLSRLAGRALAQKQGVFSSFKDATRVALSPVEMWRDIFLENRTEVLRALGDMDRELKILRSLIVAKKKTGLKSFLKRAQKVRQRYA